MDKRSKSRTFLFATIAISLSFLLSLVLLEVVAANFLLSDMQDVSKEFDSKLGWRYVPGTYKVKRQNSLVPHYIHINKFGLRSGKPPQNRRGEITRIIILGDSFTFGKVVRHEKIFTSQLENRLNQQLQGQYEVINAGIEGYGTAQQLILMKSLTEKNLVGDIYVLQVFTNDILDNLRLEYSSKSVVTLQPGYVLNSELELALEHIPYKEKRPPKSGERKTGGFRVIQVIRQIMETHVQSNPTVISLAAYLGIHANVPRMPGIVNGWYDSDVLQRGIPLMRELVSEINSEVEKQNAKLLVMFIPSPLMIYPQTYGPMLKRTFQNHPQIDDFLSDITKSQRLVIEICKEIDVPLLDMYPILLANNNKALFFPREGHLTSDGHSLVADALATELGNSYLH